MYHQQANLPLSRIICFDRHLNCSRFYERQQIDIIVCYPSASVKYPIFDFNRFADLPLQELLKLTSVVVHAGSGFSIVVFALV